MVILLALLAVAGTTVPTGIEGLQRSSADLSPLESRTASFTDISAPTGAYSNGNKVLIVAADYVAGPLASQIAQLQSDLASEGWNAVVQSMAGGTAEDLRALFQSTPDLDGAILIGFLPCAWFEEDYWASEEFPCELFLMDLDGTWTDADGNGLYDSHTGDVAPEIWLGRIDAHAMDFGSELLMLSEYLQKNHLYRTGAMAPPSRALTYIDDDWSYSYSSCGLNAIYGASGVTVVNSDGVTTAENYLDRMEEGYEFVHLMAHSSPGPYLQDPRRNGGNGDGSGNSPAEPRQRFPSALLLLQRKVGGNGMPGQLVPVRNRYGAAGVRRGKDRLNAGFRILLRAGGHRLHLWRGLPGLVAAHSRRWFLLIRKGMVLRERPSGGPYPEASHRILHRHTGG